jgi:uncharacterized protein involved in copper resistance
MVHDGPIIFGVPNSQKAPTQNAQECANSEYAGRYNSNGIDHHSSSGMETAEEDHAPCHTAYTNNI